MSAFVYVRPVGSGSQVEQDEPACVTPAYREDAVFPLFVGAVEHAAHDWREWSDRLAICQRCGVIRAAESLARAIVAESEVSN